MLGFRDRDGPEYTGPGVTSVSRADYRLLRHWAWEQERGSDGRRAATGEEEESGGPWWWWKYKAGRVAGLSQSVSDT